MNKLALGAAVALAIGAFSALPASAGSPVAQMTATPDPASTTEVVTIANEAGAANTCELPLVPSDLSAPQGISETTRVALVVEDPDGGEVFDETVLPDEDGNWSAEVGPFERGGVYTVTAQCYNPIFADFIVPSASADFGYAPISFEVVAQAPTTVTPTTPTSAVPGSSTTVTTAAAAAAKTTPRFTG